VFAIVVAVALPGGVEFREPSKQEQEFPTEIEIKSGK
jgi:hypothetical protein